MANSLNEDLTGKAVVLKSLALKPDYRDLHWRVFVVGGGFGARSFTSGTMLSGVFVADGESTAMRGYDVERYATPEEVAIAYAFNLETATDE